MDVEILHNENRLSVMIFSQLSRFTSSILWKIFDANKFFIVS